MATMNDVFVRGKTFASETGAKTGVDLEDLVTRGYPTLASQLVDQATLETYSDATVTDDDGNAINRIRVKSLGIATAELAAGAVVAAKIGVLPCFHADKNASNQDVPAAAWTKLTFGREVVKTDGALADSKWVAWTGGCYVFHAAAVVSGTTAGQAYALGLYKNGSAVAIQWFGATAVNCGMRLVSPPIVMAALTDYMEVFAYHDTGAARTVSGLAVDTWFGGWFIGGAA